MRISRLLLRNILVATSLLFFSTALVDNNPGFTNGLTFAAVMALVAAILLHIWTVLQPWR